MARAVVDWKIPVISAIWQEKDFPIVDFVADLRAPTPSAAAELVIRSRQEIEAQAEDLYRRLEHGVRYPLLMARQALTERGQNGAFARIRDGIHPPHRKMGENRSPAGKGGARILETLHP